MSPSPSVIIAKVSMSLLFHTALFPPVFVLYYELADSTTLPLRGSANFASTAFSDVCTLRSYAPRGRRYALGKARVPRAKPPRRLARSLRGTPGAALSQLASAHLKAVEGASPSLLRVRHKVDTKK
jgi:hypothetical protein